MENQNRGVIIEERDTDWVAGAVSGLDYQVLCTDWTPYLPTDEHQSGVYFDTFACVTFSALNICETLINYYIATRKLTVEVMQFLQTEGYLDENGKVNFSDRFTAKMSGTTRVGNSGQKVWDSIRKDGLLPEKDWNYPRTQRSPEFVWEDYYAEIPQHLKDKAQRFLAHFDVFYEWVSKSSFPHHALHAPLQFFAPICAGWNTPPVATCDKTRPEHATMGYDLKEKYKIKDHYNPFEKELDLDYPIPYILKGFISPKVMPTPIPTLPYYERLEGSRAIYAYDPEGDVMVPFADGSVTGGRMFKALYGSYDISKVMPGVTVKEVKELARPIASYSFTTN